MSWTGFNYGEAWPYLAAGYGLFFLCFALGFVAIWQQRRQLKRQEAMLANLRAKAGETIHGP